MCRSPPRNLDPLVYALLEDIQRQGAALEHDVAEIEFLPERLRRPAAEIPSTIWRSASSFGTGPFSGAASRPRWLVYRRSSDSSQAHCSDRRRKV